MEWIWRLGRLGLPQLALLTYALNLEVYHNFILCDIPIDKRCFSSMERGAWKVYLASERWGRWWQRRCRCSRGGRWVNWRRRRSKLTRKIVNRMSWFLSWCLRVPLLCLSMCQNANTFHVAWKNKSLQWGDLVYHSIWLVTLRACLSACSTFSIIWYGKDESGLPLVCRLISASPYENVPAVWWLV
jgi:hypothetical protein